MSTTPQQPGEGRDAPPRGAARNAAVTSEDDAVARLRAADPAATATPNPSLRAEVDTRIEASASSALPAGPPVPAGPGHPVRDELAAARARRWTTWPARVAGAAAAALVIGGGGGYAIGAAGEDPPPAASAITLTGPGQGAPGAESDTGPAAAAAGPMAATVPESARLAGSDAMYTTWPGHSGRTVFTSQGLSGSGGTAPAWAFDPALSFTEPVVAAAAAALGVAGPPRLEGGIWMAGPTDGSGAHLSVYPDGMASLNYYDPAKDPWGCPALEGAAVEDRAGGGAAVDDPAVDDPAVEDLAVEDPAEEIVPEPDPCVQRDLGAAPKGDAAVAVLRDALAALGLDPASFEIVADDTEDPMWTWVTGHHVVDGQRTGAAWHASLSGAGLQSLYGSLAPVVPVGEYEVISPAAAVERFADPRFSWGWGGPIAWAADAGPVEEEMSADVAPVDPSLPAPVEPGAAIAWPVQEVTIVEARLGAAMHTQTGGATVLVPTYELTSRDGGIWSMIAVADAHLDFSPAQP